MLNCKKFFAKIWQKTLAHPENNVDIAYEKSPHYEQFPNIECDLVAPLFNEVLDEDEYFGRFKDIHFAFLEHGKPEETGRNGKFASFYDVFEER